MGVLSSHFKPNFLGLLKFLNSMNWFIVFFSLINLSVCIYEDQIGKFDWRQTYVGRIKFAQFDTVSTAKKIIVATEENVLAALHLKTGEVVWRHVFESTPDGNIQLLHVSEKITTVTGDNPYLVRGWNPDTGVLLWEWSLMIQDFDRVEISEWWVQNGMLVHLLPVFGSHLEVTMYNLMTGSNRGSTAKLPAVWNNEGCLLTAPFYTCISGDIGSQLLLSLDVTANVIQLISKPLTTYIHEPHGSNLRPLQGNSVVHGFIVDDKKIVLIKDNDFKVLNIKMGDMFASASIVDSANGPIVVQAWTHDEQGFQLSAHTLSGQLVSEVHGPEQSAPMIEPELLAVMCARDQLACRMLVTAADESVHLVQQGGRTIWSREESLANVVAVEFVDLPVSDTDAELETEFDQKEGSVWSSFVRRLHSQYQQLQGVLRGLRGGDDHSHQTLALHRDYFNLHKIMVLVTDVGKIFGMDNLSGALVWQRYEEALVTDGVLVLRRHRLLSVVGSNRETGNGYIITLDPIRGTLVPEQTIHLDVRIQQCMVLPTPDSEKLHALVVLDEDESVQIFPRSAASLVENLYMYVAEKETAKVQGYALKYNGREVVAQRIWSVNLGGAMGGASAGGGVSSARIVALAARSRLERVRAPGRALADRSVLYKYSNPNLVLFVIEKKDTIHKEMVVAVALDVASGAPVGAAAHRRARALPFALHADNCFAYFYRSDKHRRLEIATMELYEGKDRWLPEGVPFSSFSLARAPAVERQTYIPPAAERQAYILPVVERQAYILPAAVGAAAFTLTERSLTDRHVLLALSSGGVAELPWAYLEARRGGGGEEAMLPYLPELPLPPERVLSYNRTLPRLARLHAAPAGLESTTLLLATGLDLFYTRVAPSKTFDLLKDDFDYYLITIVLGALLVATYATKYFASRKTLKLAWK